jgi:acetylglutamate kinase
MTASLSAAQKAAILAEALPYIQSLHGRTLVLRLAGSVLSDAALRAGMATDVSLLQLVGIHLVVVHDAGDRVADAAALSATNQAIVAEINRRGGKAVGLSGLDGPLIRGIRDEGATALVDRVDPELIHLLKPRNFVPVIMPIASDPAGEPLVVAADVAAGRLAEALSAERLIVLADAAGVPDAQGEARPSLSLAEAQSLLDSGEPLAEDFRARLDAVLTALRAGVKSAQLTDGRIPGALLLEVLGNAGVGSLIRSRSGPDFGADTLRYFAEG